MKALLLSLLLMSPAMAHEGHHYYPDPPQAEMSAEAYLDDYVNHGAVTCYGRVECLHRYSVVGYQNRLIVPGETQQLYRYPYNEFVTSY